MTKEEMAEYKKLNKIHDNLPKVKNLIDYKKKLQSKLTELEELKRSYNRINRFEKQKSKLEEEMKKYSERQQKIAERQKEIASKLASKELSEEERNSLNREQAILNSESAEIRQKVDLNNKFFAEKEQSIKNEDLNKKIAPKQVGKKIFEIRSQMSKCDFVGEKLMEGYDLESDFIREKITKEWKDKKFTSKEPIPGTKASEKEGKKEFEPIWSSSKLKKESENNPVKNPAKDPIDPVKDPAKDPIAPVKDPAKKLPVEEKTFEETFPRLSRVMPKFIRESKLGKALLEAKKKKDLKELEKTGKDPAKDPAKGFKDNLKFKLDYDELIGIANKGMEGYKKELHEEAKERYAKVKEKAAQREEENREEENKGVYKSQKQKIAETEASVNREAYIKRLEKEQEEQDEEK